MKNYYEILEVDRNASAEVIEKAYKTLVKKYHPDLQNVDNQNEYEEKMKDINEAYSILSDDFKRHSYDEQIQNTIISKEKYDELIQENNKLKTQLKNLTYIVNKYKNPGIQNNYNYLNNDNINYQQDSNNTIYNMGRVIRDNVKRVVTTNNENSSNMRNNKNQYYHDSKYYKKLFMNIIITILICIIIFQIPIVKRFFVHIYDENLIIQAIVNAIKKTFSTKIM